MVKAVFIQSSHSDYLDRPGEVYHFPNRAYLSRVAQTVGDWVIFFEGRRGGARGYYAVQKVLRIEPDPANPERSFAILDQASELGFENPVARLRPDGAPWESGLPLVRGSNTSAVRLISDADFAAIVSEGLREAPSPDALPRAGAISVEVAGFAEPQQAGFDGPMPESRTQILISRAFRERSFARQVKRAYRGRCAISGLELRNGGGRPEVEAAHILPVEERGPDTVRNGLALSGTIHWMFDRGLISVDEDYRILLAEGAIPGEVAERLIRPDRKLILPDDPSAQPHQAYFGWHRQHRFKG